MSMRMQVQSLALLSGLRIRCCLRLWGRSQMWFGSVLLWPWCRPAAAVPIQPLAWELPHASSVAIKRKKKKKKKKKKDVKKWKDILFYYKRNLFFCFFFCERSAPCRTSEVKLLLITFHSRADHFKTELFPSLLLQIKP